MSAAMRIGAVLVFIMGAGMLLNGLRLQGFAAPGVLSGGTAVAAQMKDGVQVVTTELRPGSYQAIRIAAGVPLRWNMHVDEKSLNGCNNRLFIPAFGVEKRLAVGDNLIEFTPAEGGVFPYSCWMGMIGSRIIVGDADDSGVIPEVNPSQLPIATEEAEDIPWL
jgi:plastocyanin domain-containing protein